MHSYDHNKIEKKWQKEWEKRGLYTTKDKVGKKKAYVLDMFPYPSGEGLHVGHPKGYIATDIFSRFSRMQGKNVLHPMGWDAFGLPAENYAIKNKVHPRKAVEKNVARFKEQLQKIGLDYDWKREINTTDPEYYKWTQWIFLQLYKKGLAYESFEPINWCPSCQTGLANEDLEDGKCERCGSVVEQRPMRQWMLKITEYAERLLKDLNLLPEWQEHIKESQRNWIGKSEGVEIDFPINMEGMRRVILLHGKGGTPDGDFMQWARNIFEKQNFEVQTPALPNTNAPDDVEQAEFISKNCTPDDTTIVIGHSAGGLAALRLVETHRIGRLVLVATPHSAIFKDGKERPSVARSLSRGYDFAQIKKNVSGGIVALYDTTDNVVSVEDGEKFAKELDALLLKVKAAEPHFNSEKEPHVITAATPSIRVFTTRADTLFGVTYLVLAPEHPLVAEVCASQTCTNRKEIEEYVKKTKNKTDLERQEAREKTGVRIEGVTAKNPATGEDLPIFIADYVLAHYGTGAIMAVPAHDERDREFAEKFKLPSKTVVERVLKNSGEFDGLTPEEATIKITEKFGVKKTTYKLRDWVFSRQRYWGEPIPIIHCEKCGVVPVPEKDLPVKLPDVRNYAPTGTGESPLAAIKKWVDVECPACAEENKKTKYLIFDFDGVLGDTLKVNLEARIRMGEAKDMAESIAQMEKYFSAKPHHVRGDHFTLNHKKDYDDWSYRYAIEAAKLKYKMFDGFIREIKKLKNVKVAVVSAGYDLYSKEPLKKSGLKYTHFLAGNHDHSKENKIEKVCRAWKVDVKDVYYFTDTQADVYELENLLDRKKIIGCAWGYQGEKKLRELLPENQVLKKFSDIHTLWKPHIGKRETNTMPQWAGSSWYWLRYMDPKNKKALVDKKKEKYWAPVDMYVGGAEHATRHLIYARFWHKFLRDIGVVSTPEPFTRLVSVGLIMAEDGRKMSKRYGNVINPDDIVETYGADTLRIYEMFMGPFTDAIAWKTSSLIGARRFLERVWRLQDSLIPQTHENVERLLHQTIKKVGEDIQNFKFNTAISQMMIFVNEAEKSGVTKKQYQTFITLLAPFAPHITEEIWWKLGNPGRAGKKSVHVTPWATYDASKLVANEVTIVVQVNGKARGQVLVPRDSSEASVRAEAVKLVEKWLVGESVHRVVFVSNRLINFVL